MSRLLKVLSGGSLVLMALCIAGAVGAVEHTSTYSVVAQVIISWVLFVIFGTVSLVTGFAADRVK